MTGPKARRILVTGGAGFIGRQLVAALHAQGDRVVVLDDLSGGDPAGLPGTVDVVVADVADPHVVERIVALRPTHVVHAAAQVSVARSMADPARDRAVNLVGTAHVTDAARTVGARRIVFVSSGGAVYGETPLAAADEATLPTPMSYYGVHKLAAERYVALGGLSHAIARPSNVYGPGQRSDLEGGVVAIFCERLAAGLPVTIYGSGLQSRDFLSVFDLVAGLRLLLDDGPSGTWNIASGTETSVVDLLAEIEQQIGRRTTVDWRGPRVGEVRRSALSAELLRTELGWRPERSLADGLREVLGPLVAGR